MKGVFITARHKATGKQQPSTARAGISRSVRSAGQRFLEWLRGQAKAQAGRAALLAPLALMGGAAWRLTPMADLPGWLVWACAPLLLLVGGRLARPKRVLPGPLGQAIALIAFGLMLSGWACLGAIAVDVRLRWVEAPRLEAQIGPVRVTGWVMAIESGLTRPRMRLRVHTIEGMEKPPLYVQLSPPIGTALSPGRAANCLAVLGPSSLPILPGTYDPGRRLFFARVGGAGYTLGSCRAIALAPPPWPVRALLWLQAVRRDLAETLADAAPGAGGALAAAVLIGDRTLLDNVTNTAFQNSGLAHLLSVSGLHMSLVAGLAFAAFYFALAFVPDLALRWPLKKVAAGAALLAALAYLVLSGSSLPAQRAFVMTGAALGAILLDRPAFTMRALAAAAVIVVVLAPESVLDVGFQMSFAATAALVAFFEAGSAKTSLPSPGPIIGAMQSVWGALRNALTISFVAGLATDPIAAFHFQRVTLYGLAANLAAAPLISFVVAPAALLALVATPLGWDGPLQLAAWGLELIGGVGAAFGERPDAIRAIPAMPPSSFLLFLAAIAWLCIWRGALRWLGLACAAWALWLYAVAPQPILLIDGEGKVLLARSAQGWAMERAPRGARFAQERLGQRAGLDAQTLATLPSLQCDADACQWRTPFGHRAALVRSSQGEAAMCQRTQLLIRLAPRQAGESNCAQGLVIRSEDLQRKGGAAVYDGRTGLKVRYALAGPQPVWRGKPANRLTHSAEPEPPICPEC